MAANSRSASLARDDAADRVAAWTRGYVPLAEAPDEFIGPDGGVRPHWRHLLNGLVVMQIALSLALLAVIAQQLVPAIDRAGRYPATEIMVATTAIRNLIRTAQDHQLRSQISTGSADGMTTMDQSLAELVRMRRISREMALAHCYHPDELRSLLSRIG